MRRKGSRQLRGTIRADEVKLLQQALSAARLERCGCSAAAQEEFRLYLNSWVASPIAQVLAGIKRRHDRKSPVLDPSVPNAKENGSESEALSR